MGNAQKKHTGLKSPIDDIGDDEEFTCEICIEPMNSRNKKFNNNNKCVHPFCSDCIIKYIESKLEDNICNIQCPALHCNNSLHPLDCRPKIPRQLFDKWSDLLCNTMVLELNGVYCPNRDCSALVLNECGGDVRRSTCPRCKKPFCFRCRMPWHASYRCEETRTIRDQNDIAFGELIEKSNWQRCPKCGQCVERIEGCDLVRCRCGSTFNYRDPTFKGLACELLLRILVVITFPCWCCCWCCYCCCCE